MRYYAPLLAIALALPATAASSAVLLGAEVTAQYTYPDLATAYPDATYSPQPFIVGAGQDATISLENVTTFNVDFSDTALDLVFDTTLMNPDPTFTNASFNGLIFTSSNFNLIDSITIGATTNLAGFDLSRVSIVDDELRLNFAGLTYNTDTVIGLNFTPVPEPGTWAMMLLGFGAVGFAMRRRKQTGLAFRQIA